MIIERFARERLRAVAHAQGRVEKPLDEVVRRSAKSLIAASASCSMSLAPPEVQ